MLIINSRTDIETYIHNYHYDMCVDRFGPALRNAIQAAEHPPYGQDWAAWLEANIDGLRESVVEARK